MSEKAVRETFEALFALTELRGIYREVKPTFRLNENHRQAIRKILERVRRSLEIIEKELLG
jgi:hypothetical protein